MKQLLVEYDDQSWEQREWISVHQDDALHVFLVEHDLWWAPQPADQQLFPALVRISPCLPIRVPSDERTARARGPARAGPLQFAMFYSFPAESLRNASFA